MSAPDTADVPRKRRSKCTTTVVPFDILSERIDQSLTRPIERNFRVFRCDGAVVRTRPVEAIGIGE